MHKDYRLRLIIADGVVDDYDDDDDVPMPTTDFQPPPPSSKGLLQVSARLQLGG